MASVPPLFLVSSMNRFREWTLNAATAVLAMCALVAVTLRVRDALRPDPMKPTHIRGAEAYRLSGHRIGPVNAPVQVVEFADYQCPFCQQVDPVLIALRERYPDQVSIIYRHFPLAIHDSAAAAARVAECAAAVGDFDRFHHFLFANAKLIGHQPWHWFAQQAGVRDLDSFDKCVLEVRVFPSIQEDRVAGERLGVVATPTFLVNDTRLAGYLPLDDFDKLVSDAIKDAENARR